MSTWKFIETRLFTFLFRLILNMIKSSLRSLGLTKSLVKFKYYELVKEYLYQGDLKIF